MKDSTAFLICSALLVLVQIALGQQPAPPTNLRMLSVDPVPNVITLTVTRGTNNPLGFEHLGYAAWWQPPDTNIWIPEISTNGVDWTFAGNQWAQLPDRAARQSGAPYLGWNFTETSTNWTTNWQVRIRKK